MRRAFATAALLLFVLAILPAQSQRQTNQDAPIAVDHFTAPDGTALENHQLNSGQSWLHAPYAASGVIAIDDNWAHHGSAGLRSIYLANVQLSADCYASWRVKLRDATNPYLVLRAKSPGETYLAVYYDFPAQTWVMMAVVDYVGPQSVYQLGVWPETITAGEVRDVRLQAIGDELRFFTRAQGQWIERIFAESYYVLGAGMAGIGLHGPSSPAGTYIDDFEAGNVTGPSPSPSPTASPTPYASPSPSPSSSPTPSVTPTPAPAVYEWQTFDIENDVGGQLMLLGAQGYSSCTEIRFKLRCSRRIQ